MNSLFLIGALCLVGGHLLEGCLITNCPRGGKRSSKLGNIDTANIKQCVSCGPNHSGQCFGPNICCGPFGCLIGTAETIKCQRDGAFHDSEPCIAGSASCKRNSGRCAAEGVCCSQEWCHADKSCYGEKRDVGVLDIYNMLNYPSLEYPIEINK